MNLDQIRLIFFSAEIISVHTEKDMVDLKSENI